MKFKIDIKTISMGLLFLIVLVIMIYSIFAMDSFNKKKLSANSADRISQIEDIIRKSVNQCYALEGSYPPDLQYLVDHYGLILDYETYFYFYEAHGGNLRFNIKVESNLFDVSGDEYEDEYSYWNPDEIDESVIDDFLSFASNSSDNKGGVQ